MKSTPVILLLLCAPLLLARAADSPLYENTFETAEIGTVPSDMLVLDGGFAVKEEAGKKFLELPGAPLDTFSAQFGPAETNAVSVTALIRSSAKGRRFPSFGIGLYGVAGFKLQVSPGKKSLELYKDQVLLGAVPFEWKSGQWTELRLQARKISDGAWNVEGKAWTHGDPEPSAWTISAQEKEDSFSGRASLFGSPFSGTPIQFDDLKVQKLDSK